MATCEHKHECKNESGECSRLAPRFLGAKKNCFEATNPHGLLSGEVPGYVPQSKYDTVCDRLAVAHELIDKLYESGCLDAEREEMVQAFLYSGT